MAYACDRVGEYGSARKTTSWEWRATLAILGMFFILISFPEVPSSFGFLGILAGLAFVVVSIAAK